MLRVVPAVIVFFFLPSVAVADRAPTPEERAEVEATIKAEGCTGGRIEFDEEGKEFAVKNVQCDDGKPYEFKLDANYAVTKKELDE